MRYDGGMPETPLVTYLRIQQATDKAMLRSLRAAAADVEVQLRKIQRSSKVGDQIRADQLRRSQQAINTRLSRFWLDAGEITKAQKTLAAAAAAENSLKQSEALLRTVYSEADFNYMVQSARAQAERGLEALEQRISGTSYRPLADSVWSNQRWANSELNTKVNNALARGASARELAADVRDFVNPNTPGGVRYASMRLARTEINNSFHASQIKQAQEEPWTIAVKWHLSGSHPKPDACNDYADDVHFRGGEPGQWRPEEIPGKPHPNCLCYTTPETLSPDQFVDSYVRGDFDGYFDELESPGGLLAPRTPSSAPTAPKPPAPAPAPTAPKPVDAFDDLPRMEPQAYDEAYKLANPGYRYDPSYQSNCHFVVETMEMRARGYDVVAAQTYASNGRFARSIAQSWRNPETGRPGNFQTLSSTMLKRNPRTKKFDSVPDTFESGGATFTGYEAALLRATQHWPNGARGILQMNWTRGGGGHVMNVFKDDLGNIRMIDGQVSKLFAEDALERIQKLSIMRIDNLEPIKERVRASVDNVGVDRAANARWRQPTPESQLEALETIVGQYERDILNVPRNHVESWQDHIDRLKKDGERLAKRVRGTSGSLQPKSFGTG